MNLLLGGLITLAVTALVQVLIIPWVQRRNRKLERWEDHLAELENYLFEDISIAFNAVDIHAGVVGTRAPRSTQLEEYRKSNEKLHELIGELSEKGTHLFLLFRRVRQQNRTAPLWKEIESSIASIRMWSVTFGSVVPPLGSTHGTTADQRKAIAAMREELNLARDLVDIVAAPMKPPPRGPIGRWAFRRTRRRLGLEPADPKVLVR